MEWMDAPEALAYIAARLAPDNDPPLSAPEVAGLLSMAAGTDSANLPPSHADWTPTYTVRGCYMAIAEGWAIKRGKVAGRYDFTTDGQMFRRSQMRDHIDAEHRRWLAKVQSCPSTLGTS
jgi:hypothetical protein